MRKKVFLGVLSIIMILVLAGCGNNGQNELKYGETKKVKNSIEITIKSNKVVDQIDPSSPTAFYRVYKAGEGYKYLDIVAEVKNISSKSITMGDMGSAKLEIGKDSYDVICMAEENNDSWINGDASKKKIEPNETIKYHMVTKIEESKFEKDFDAVLNMKLSGKKYTYNMKIVNGEGNEEVDSSTIYLLGNGKNIKVDELVAIDNSCEFTIKSNEFEKVVKPTNPKGVYKYLNAGGDKIYLNVKVTAKNTQSVAVKQNTLLGKIRAVYDGNEYSCTKVTENENGTNINTNTSTADIDSQASMQYFILAKLPEEAQNSTKPLYVKFSIDGKNYLYRIR